MERARLMYCSVVPYGVRMFWTKCQGRVGGVFEGEVGEYRKGVEEGV